MNINLRADDRVLMLAIPPDDQLAALGRILMRGVLVGLGSPSEVDRARRAMIEFENAMFIEGEQSRIPWRDHFFTKVLLGSTVLTPELEAELRRVLLPEGVIVS